MKERLSKREQLAVERKDLLFRHKQVGGPPASCLSIIARLADVDADADAARTVTNAITSMRLQDREAALSKHEYKKARKIQTRIQRIHQKQVRNRRNAVAQIALRRAH